MRSSPSSGWFLSLVVGVLFAASPALAATYYVATTGSDSWPGTLSQPFRTLGKAATVVVAGDTVYLRGGTYYEQVRLTKAGTSSARITFSAYAGEVPILDGSNHSFTSGGLLHVEATADYNTIIGLTIQRSPNRGISSYGSYVRFDSVKVADSWKAGISIDDSTGTEVIHSEVVHNVLENENDRYVVQLGKTGGWAAALTATNSTNILFSQNEVHDNWGEGISSYYRSSGIHYVGNTSHDNYGVDLYLDGSKDSVVERNLVYETNTTYLPRYVNGVETSNWRRLATGIAVSEEDYTFKDPNYTCQMTNNVVKNNFVINTRISFTNYNYLACGGLKYTKVVNNTFVNSWDNAVRARPGAHLGTVFQNNILHARQSNIVEFGSPNDTKFENNIVYRADGTSSGAFLWNGTPYDFAGWDGASSSVTANVWAGPGLVALGSLSGDIAGNHKLASGSVAIDKGLTTSVTSHDYWGGSRPVDGDGNATASYDVGAHEAPAPSSVTYLLNDTFNSQTTGSAPSGYTSLTGATIAEVPSATNKSLQFDDTNTAGRAQATRSFTAQTRTLTLEYRFMVPAAIDYSGVNLKSATVHATTVMTLGGNLVYVSSGSVNIPLQAYSPGIWYSIKVVANPSTDKADIYVDGLLRGAQLSFTNTVSSLDSFNVGTGNGATGLTYVDDVKVSY